MRLALALPTVRFVAALALVALSPAARAQVERGLVELGGSASLTSVDAGADRATVFIFSPTFGYFLTDAVEAGLAASYIKAEGFDAQGVVGAFASYHIAPRRATTVPFVGVGVATSFTGESDVVGSAFGGAKFFFFRGGALTGQAVVRSDFDEATDFGLEAGVSIFL